MNAGISARERDYRAGGQNVGLLLGFIEQRAKRLAGVVCSGMLSVDS